jgi:hypothetical protein
MSGFLYSSIELRKKVLKRDSHTKKAPLEVRLKDLRETRKDILGRNTKA